ncbi:hypothetical protein Hanom_Chr02g00162141 [Helianthus anomalus]
MGLREYGGVQCAYLEPSLLIYVGLTLVLCHLPRTALAVKAHVDLIVIEFVRKSEEDGNR